MGADPRVEAAARAMWGGDGNGVSWPPGGESVPEAELWREQARDGLAAADAADPLRDRGRAVPIIEQTLLDRWPLKASAAWVPRLAEAVFDALTGNGE